jgi:hypothetical protein
MKHTYLNFTNSLFQVVCFLLCFPLYAQLSVSPQELIFDGIKNNTIGPKSVIIQNTGTSDVEITSFQFAGTNHNKFSTSTSPQTLTQGQTLIVEVTFNPNSSDVGYFEAVLNLNTSTLPQVQVGVYGLSTNGLEGANEPTLNNVLKTLGYNITIGWSNLEGGTQTTLKGDEVSTRFFEKISAGATVNILPVGRYSPAESLPFGYYTKVNATPSLHQVHTIKLYFLAWNQGLLLLTLVMIDLAFIFTLIFLGEPTIQKMHSIILKIASVV